MLGRGSYCKKVRLESRECDTLSRLTPMAALRHIQDVSTAGLDKIGMTHKSMLEKYGFVFVAVGHAVRWERPLLAGEEVTVITHPMGTRGPHFFRQVEFFDEAGLRVIEAQTDWVLMDFATARPLRATTFPQGVLESQEEHWHPFCDPSKIRIPTADTPAGSYTVLHEDTDLNLHLNNTVYARIMLESCGNSQRPIREFYIRYHRQALEGQEITLFKGERDGAVLSTGKLNSELCYSGSFVHF